MAKRTKSPSQPNRKHISRMQREMRLKRYIYTGAGIVFGLIIILMAWGFYYEFAVKAHQPVAVVNGEEISLEEYQSLVRYRRYDYRLYLENLQSQRAQFAATEGQEFLVQYIDQEIEQVQNELAMLPTSIVEELIEDRITRQEAERRGIVVTAEDVQLELERQFEYDRNPPETEPGEEEVTELLTETVSATPMPLTEEEFIERTTGFFDVVENVTRFTEQDFRRLIESLLYRRMLEEALIADLPTTVAQVHARHILVETPEEAEMALERLADGETFEALAQELSIDTVSGEQGGDLGWFARGGMVDPFDTVVWELSPGEISDVVETQFGYHVIELLERNENRELDDIELEQFQREAINAWYAERASSQDVERYWDQSMVP